MGMRVEAIVQTIPKSARAAHCDRRPGAGFCPSFAGDCILLEENRPAPAFHAHRIFVLVAIGVGGRAVFLFLFCAAAAFILGFAGFCKPLAWMRGGIGSNEDVK